MTDHNHLTRISTIKDLIRSRIRCLLKSSLISLARFLSRLTLGFVILRLTILGKYWISLPFFWETIIIETPQLSLEPHKRKQRPRPHLLLPPPLPSPCTPRWPAFIGCSSGSGLVRLQAFPLLCFGVCSGRQSQKPSLILHHVG